MSTVWSVLSFFALIIESLGFLFAVLYPPCGFCIKFFCNEAKVKILDHVIHFSNITAWLVYGAIFVILPTIVPNTISRLLSMQKMMQRDTFFNAIEIQNLMDF